MKWANVTLFIKNIAKLHTYKHTYTLALAAADLKSAMENGSLCQVVLNKDFFQYGCNRVHLSSSLLIYSSTMYIVMVVCSGADCHSKKTRPGANIFFYIFSSQSFCGTRNFTVPYNFQTPFTLQEVKQNGSLASFIAYVSRPPACWAIALVN